MRLRLLEASDRLGGNHTWSFFETDLTPAQCRWVDPLVAHRWAGYEVRFPALRRRLGTGYRSVTSERLNATIAKELDASVTLGAAVADVGPERVVLSSGTEIRAACVIDARGIRQSPHLVLGFQKFLGVEMRLAEPHGLDVPIIMDATVAQHDGYRFVYLLPLDERRVLIEDTYYSDGSDLPTDRLKTRALSYASLQGWQIAEVVREESGVLPIVLAGRYEKFVEENLQSAARIGLAAALFHPTTGYSFPDAVRLADRIARAIGPGAASSDIVRAVVTSYGREVWQQRSYFRLLNRMLFRAGLPQHRFSVLQRFYGFDQGLIERFYAARQTPLDKLRLILGKPPVPILTALGCVSETRMLKQAEVVQ